MLIARALRERVAVEDLHWSRSAGCQVHSEEGQKHPLRVPGVAERAVLRREGGKVERAPERPNSTAKGSFNG